MSIVTSLSTVSRMMLAFPALGSRTTATSAQLYYFLESAGYEVIAKLAKLYDVPYAQTSGDLHLQVSNITTKLALQGYFQEKAFMQERSNESEWPDEFDKAREMLDDIADGSFPLVNNDGSIIPSKTSERLIYSNTSSYLPTFHEAGELNHVIDNDKIDDVLLDRLITL